MLSPKAAKIEQYKRVHLKNLQRENDRLTHLKNQNAIIAAAKKIHNLILVYIIHLFKKLNNQYPLLMMFLLDFLLINQLLLLF